MGAGGKDIKLDPLLSRFGKIVDNFTAIRHGFAEDAALGSDLPCIFCGIGKQVGIHLGQQTDIHHYLKFLVQHVGRSFHRYAGRANTGGIVFKLGKNNLFFHKAAFRMQDQMAFFKMLAPEQTF